LISPLAPLLSQRIGLKRSLGLSLVLIIIGFTGRLLPCEPSCRYLL
jgi:CP family cyanate transporter-like MFS transporter